MISTEVQYNKVMLMEKFVQIGLTECCDLETMVLGLVSKDLLLNIASFSEVSITIQMACLCMRNIVGKFYSYGHYV